MKPLIQDIWEGWVHTMRQCAGLPPEPPERTGGTPRVLFLNRAVASGRSVLSMGQVEACQLVRLAACQQHSLHALVPSCVQCNACSLTHLHNSQ